MILYFNNQYIIIHINTNNLYSLSLYTVVYRVMDGTGPYIIREMIGWVCGCAYVCFHLFLVYFVFSIFQALMFKSLTKATANARHETHHAEACIPERWSASQKVCGSMAADWMFPSALYIWIIWSSWLDHTCVILSYALYPRQWTIGWVAVDGVQRVDGTDQKNDVQPEKGGTGRIFLSLRSGLQFPWTSNFRIHAIH